MQPGNENSSACHCKRQALFTWTPWTVPYQLLTMPQLRWAFLCFGRAVLALKCSVSPAAAQSVVQDNATAPSGNRQLLAAVLFALSVAILLPVLPPGGAGGSDNLFL